MSESDAEIDAIVQACLRQIIGDSPDASWSIHRISQCNETAEPLYSVEITVPFMDLPEVTEADKEAWDREIQRR